MPQWKVTLVGDSGDLGLLSHLFKCGEYRIADGGTGYALFADAFEPLKDSRQVRELAQEIILILNGLARARDLSQQAVSIGNVICTDEQGHEHVHAVISAATLRARAFGVGVVVSADGQVQKDRGDEQSQALACLAASHSAVAKVLKHLGGELNWFTLSYIYEIIEREAGGQQSQITKKGWASAQELRDFWRTANWYEIDGARHAVPTKKTPENPMSLQEARGFIHSMVNRWLQDILVTQAYNSNN